jgi:purine catabolism regulator
MSTADRRSLAWHGDADVVRARETQHASAVLTVADVLELEVLRAGAPEVVAGRAGLGRSVRWAHASEVPNIAALLRGGELVLTTGMRMPGDDRGVRRFVAGLADRGVAGLVIELGSSLRAVPRSLIQTADARELPVIALHGEVAFVDVTLAINFTLQERHIDLLRRVDELQRRFTQLMVDGADIPVLLDAVVAAIGNPVVLEREDGELLFHSAGVDADGAVLTAWDRVRRRLPAAPHTVVVEVPTGREQAPGRLIALALSGPLTLVTRPALERASGLLALATRQARQEEILVARSRGNLLASLVEGNASEAEIVRQLATIGIARTPECLVPFALAPSATHRGVRAPDEVAWTAVWHDIQRHVEARALIAVGGLLPRRTEIAFVLGVGSAAPRQAWADEFHQVIATALQRHLASPDAGVLFVGAGCESWTAVVDGLGEVLDASAFPRAGVDGWMDATSPDLDRVLWRLGDDREVRAFIERRLGPVLEHDRRRPSKLLPTLEAFIVASGQKSEMARLLHLERQSVYHRIAKIEALLGSSLDDEETRLGVHLALRVLRFAPANA